MASTSSKAHKETRGRLSLETERVTNCNVESTRAVVHGNNGETDLITSGKERVVMTCERGSDNREGRRMTPSAIIIVHYPSFLTGHKMRGELF